ncbi:unnamed protein product [Caretta caretta]
MGGLLVPLAALNNPNGIVAGRVGVVVVPGPTCTSLHQHSGLDLSALKDELRLCIILGWLTWPEKEFCPWETGESIRKYCRQERTSYNSTFILKKKQAPQQKSLVTQRILENIHGK